MFKFKKILASVLAIGVLASMSTSVFASEVEKVLEVSETTSSTEVSPRINKTVSVSLNNTSWTTVVSDNNWFDAYVNVLNSAENPGTITVQIINEKGKIIDGPSTISAGNSADFTVPSSAEKYTVKAKGNSGTYSITVKDRGYN